MNEFAFRIHHEQFCGMVVIDTVKSVMQGQSIVTTSIVYMVDAGGQLSKQSMSNGIDFLL